eukprot:1063855-Amphidinium_carterae.1
MAPLYKTIHLKPCCAALSEKTNANKSLATTWRLNRTHRKETLAHEVYACDSSWTSLTTSLTLLPMSIH